MAADLELPPRRPIVARPIRQAADLAPMRRAVPRLSQPDLGGPRGVSSAGGPASPGSPPGMAPARRPARALLRSAGLPLAPPLRARLERAMRTDLGSARLHTDATAARIAAGHRANAVTLGRDIFFAAGRFRPETPVGFALLVHELTHVRQQLAGAVSTPPDGLPGPLPPMQQRALEQEARAHESAALVGAPLPPLRVSVGGGAPVASPAMVAAPRHGHQQGRGDLFPPLPMAWTPPPAPAATALRQETGAAVAPVSASADGAGPAADTSAAPDPDRLAEQVYARIERRLRLERERGGVQRWR